MDNIWFNVSLILGISMALLIGIFGVVALKFNTFSKFVELALQNLASGEWTDYNKKIFRSKKLEKLQMQFRNHGLSVQQKFEMAQQIVNGDEKLNLDNEFSHDKFSSLLLELHTNLQNAKTDEADRREEEEKQNWATKGEALFADILRNSGVDLKELSFLIIQKLVDYTHAIQGGLFALEEVDEEASFDLKASIAYDRRKLVDSTFKIGEGLVGRCAHEKLTVYLEDVPKDYVYITSGLGEANPRSVLLVPAKLEDKVFAVIELVSFNKFEPYQIKFIEKIGASIASTISNAKTNENTRRLLEQSKLQSEEMAAQEEEMRQNLEELQATQEEVGRLREEDRQKNEKMINEVELHRKTLIKILDQIPSKIFLKDDDCRMLIVNKAVLDAHNATKEDLLGKNDFDFIDDKNEAQKFYDDEQEIIKSGNPKRVLQKEIVNDTGLYLDSIKIPFYIDYLGVTGILGVQNDVTETVELKEKIKSLESPERA